jgi:hypothetical protein
MKREMRVALAALITVTAADSAPAKQSLPEAASGCAFFYNQLARPMIMQSRRITGEALGGILQTSSDGTRRTFRIGPFLYNGAGREARSADPRFEGVRVSGERGLYHRCGHKVELLSDRLNGNSSQGSESNLAMRFQRESGLEFAPGSTAAAIAGAIPVLTRYEPGASWPIHAPGAANSFIGLMHPEDGRPETLIVSFEKSESPAQTRVLARLPMRFQLIRTLPNLHKAGAVATLVGRDPGGAFREIALEMPDKP